MKAFTKFLLFALLMTALPAKNWAQTPYRQYADEGVLLNAYEIDNVGFRVFLLYNLHQDDSFDVIANDEPGQFSIVPGHNGNTVNFIETFESAYRRAYADFSLFTKPEIDNYLSVWKSNIPPKHYISLTLDIELRHSRPSNNHCADSDPFCTSENYTFEAAATSQTADQLEGTTIEDGCIGSSYNPSWYHMRIHDSGQFVIHMEGRDPSTGTTRDIDFCIWGPFTDPTSACVAGLTTSNIIDCCYSTSYVEDIYLGYAAGDHVHNTSHGTVSYHVPVQGEYYILMITNFSQQPCVITFTKTPGSGPGTTDCDILPGIVNNDGPYCVGETIHLTVNQQSGATYTWTGPNGFTATGTNPTLTNCTLNMAGTYTCTTHIGLQTTSSSTDVVIYALPEASFTATTVCLGNPTEFTSTATADGQDIAEYSWDFGDDGTGSGATTSHTYTEAGTYQVTHTVVTRNGCADEVRETITVIAAPEANFTATTVCQGEATQFTSTTTGEQITGYSWNFGDGNTGSGETTTHTYTEAGTYQVILTAEGSGGTCAGTSIQNVTVNAMPDPVGSANPASVQYAEASTITVDPGAEGTFTYHWEPENMVVNPNSQTTQTVPLTESQVYTVTVTNTEGGCTTTIYVPVVMDGSNMTATATADQYQLCEGSSTTLHAIPLAGTGNYTYSWTPTNTLDNPTSMNPVATPGLGTTTYSCHVTDGIVDTDVSVDITVYPNKETDIEQTICEGSSYNFFGQQVSQAGIYHHTLTTDHGCDSIINLTLGINDHDESAFTVPEEEACDEYFWDPQGHEIIQTDHDGLVYTLTGRYHRTYKNIKDCDSLVTMNIRMEYTPHPTPIYPMDPTNATPHWVVSASEFQINTYDFYLWDINPLCYWDTVTWTLEGAPRWFIEPFGDRGTCCKVYTLDMISDTAWLKAYAFNRCSPENGVMQKYWLICSFYDVDEQHGVPADFSVVPNPNNGLMTLNFENLTGKIDIKVYDMRGALIDNIETYNGTVSSSLSYDMSRHANGLYHFVVTGKEGTLSKKVVVQH
jgi:PKD repeat protein